MSNTGYLPQIVRVQYVTFTDSASVPAISGNMRVYNGLLQIYLGAQWYTIAPIQDGSITTVMLADSAVTTAKLANLAVTTAKLADESVTTDKIAPVNITTAKIVDQNITTAKIADANVTEAKLANSSVATAKVADLAVTGAKIAARTIAGDKFATTVFVDSDFVWNYRSVGTSNTATFYFASNTAWGGKLAIGNDNCSVVVGVLNNVPHIGAHNGALVQTTWGPPLHIADDGGGVNMCVTNGRIGLGVAQDATAKVKTGGSILLGTDASTTNGTVKFDSGVFQFRESGAWRTIPTPGTTLRYGSFDSAGANNAIFPAPNVGLTVVRNGTGDYTVTFANLGNFNAHATLNDSNGGYATIIGTGGNTDIFVRTYNLSGALADRGFNVTVFT